METVFLDNGTESIKFGTSRKKFTVQKMLSVIGTKVDVERNSSKEVYFGAEALRKRYMLDLVYPVRQGLIADWEAAEKLWQHLLEEQLAVEPTEAGFLLSEPPNAPKSYREKVAELLFEKFKCNRLFVHPTPALSLAGKGLTSGLVLDSGHGVTHITPVYEGFAVNNANVRLELCGKRLTEYLLQLFREKGHPVAAEQHWELFMRLKEEKCVFPVDYERLVKEIRSNSKAESFALPDGRRVPYTDEFIRCSEVMFHPTKITGEVSMGIHEAVSMSLKKSDELLRRLLYNNMLFTGGNTKIKQFGHRFLTEISTFIPPREEIKIIQNTTSKHFAFQGALILSELGNFQSRWVTRKEYYDGGASILFKKLY